MTDARTLYKLIILYMLRRANFPLTNAQITEFMVSKEYTNYFGVQEAIGDLIEAKLITSERLRNTSQYQASIDGENTLEYFSYMISDGIKKDIDEFVRENAFSMRNESSTKSDYILTENKEYAVHCWVQEGRESLIDLTINVPTEGEAEQVCANWPSKSQEIYKFVLENLLEG